MIRVQYRFLVAPQGHNSMTEERLLEDVQPHTRGKSVGGHHVLGVVSSHLQYLLQDLFFRSLLVDTDPPVHHSGRISEMTNFQLILWRHPVKFTNFINRLFSKD